VDVSVYVSADLDGRHYPTRYRQKLLIEEKDYVTEVDFSATWKRYPDCMNTMLKIYIFQFQQLFEINVGPFKDF
jgi:hypothetical protein